MLAFSFLIALLLLLTFLAEDTLSQTSGIAQRPHAISTSGWARMLLTHATQLLRSIYEVSLDGRTDHLYRDAEMHQDSRQKTQLPLNMNFYQHRFPDPNQIAAIGTLDAAEVFSQEDFDPTPEDLGICPCCCDYDLALEAYMAEA